MKAELGISTGQNSCGLKTNTQSTISKKDRANIPNYLNATKTEGQDVILKLNTVFTESGHAFHSSHYQLVCCLPLKNNAQYKEEKAPET